MATRILIIDDSNRYLAAASAVCRATPGCELVATAGSRAEALGAARTCRADLILVDVRLGDDDGVALAAELRGIAPRASVIVCSTLTIDDLPTTVNPRYHLNKEDLSVAVLRALVARPAANVA